MKKEEINKLWEERMYEIHSIVNDILYEAERGKVSWKEACFQVKAETSDLENLEDEVFSDPIKIFIKKENFQINETEAGSAPLSIKSEKNENIEAELNIFPGPNAFIILFDNNSPLCESARKNLTKYDVLEILEIGEKTFNFVVTDHDGYINEYEVLVICE